MSRSLQALAGIDLRLPAAFRVGLGMLVWLNQFVALTNARVFYSDAGFLPRSLLHEHFATSPGSGPCTPSQGRSRGRCC